MSELQKEFERLGPWVTRFEFDGRSYGGKYYAGGDDRLMDFRRHFPDTNKRVLELGCLEGGHTIEIARHSDHVIAIEGRAENRRRAEWIAKTAGVRNLEFHDGNLETIDFEPFGVFDVCFNVGVLYHLPEPWNLVSKLARCSRAMFLWTHIAKKSSIKRGGYGGVMYRECGRRDPLSGLSSESFWPTHDELIRMLNSNGFTECETLGLADTSCIVKCRSMSFE